MRLTFSLAQVLYPRVKLKTASSARLNECYKSWLIFRGSYTPQYPINSSSENELRAGNQRESKTDEGQDDR